MQSKHFPQEGKVDERLALGNCGRPTGLPRTKDRPQHLRNGHGEEKQNNSGDSCLSCPIIVQAFQGYPVYLDEPWLIDVSHLLLVVAASCNVVIVAVQVGAKSRNDDGRGFCPHILQLLKIEYALMAQVEIVCHLHRSTYI